jgi:hypothetical protein
VDHRLPGDSADSLRVELYAEGYFWRNRLSLMPALAGAVDSGAPFFISDISLRTCWSCVSWSPGGVKTYAHEVGC